jgi:hypothetical protein
MIVFEVFQVEISSDIFFMIDFANTILQCKLMIVYDQKRKKN